MLVNDIERPKMIYHHNSDSLVKNISEDKGGLDSNIERNFSELTEQSKQLGKTKLKRRSYIIDDKTSNLSFIKLHKDLKALGIKNNKFFLRLYDKDLQGVNPYQANLPVDLQIKIFIECVINPWYFLREVCRIPQDGTELKPGGGTQYKIDRNNLATWYLALNGIDVYKSKPRQQGKTQDALALMNYAFHFGTMSSNFSFFNKKAEDAQLNLGRLKAQRDCLPTYLQMRTAIVNEGAKFKEVGEGNNIRSFVNPINHNKITCMPKATSQESGMSIGRGFTTAIQHFDECDFTPWIDEILNSSVFAFKTAHQNAIENKAMSMRIFTSTPGDLQFRSGAYMSGYIKQMVHWNDKMLDDPITKLKSALQKPKTVPVVFVEHTWQQLGLSVQWYESACADVKFDTSVIAREIDLQRINGSNNSPFDRKDIYYITTHKKTPIISDDILQIYAPINIYEPLHRQYHYILGVDPSEGLNQDNNAFTLINVYTQKPAAEFKCPYISPKDFSILITKFLDKYCPKTMIVVENNRGRELIARLEETRYRPNIYYDADKFTAVQTQVKDEYGALIQQAKNRSSMGISTTGKSRPLMFGVLEEFMHDRKDCLCSENIVNDICGLVRRHTGKVEAGADQHDDSIMSYLMGLYVYYNASNLEEYGIYRGMRAPSIDGIETESELLSRINNFMKGLPEEIQKMFNQHKTKDPVSESERYYKMVEQEQNNFYAHNPYLAQQDENRLVEYSSDSDFVYRNMTTRLMTSDPLYNQPSGQQSYDSYNNNDFGGYDDTYGGGSSNNFDINDYV